MLALCDNNRPCWTTEFICIHRSVYYGTTFGGMCVAHPFTLVHVKPHVELSRCAAEGGERWLHDWRFSSVWPGSCPHSRAPCPAYEIHFVSFYHSIRTTRRA